MRIMKMWSLARAALALGALLTVPSLAQQDQMITTARTATLGPVQAVLSYQEKPFANLLEDTRLYQPLLKVIREGKPSWRRPCRASARTGSHRSTGRKCAR